MIQRNVFITRGVIYVEIKRIDVDNEKGLVYREGEIAGQRRW